MTETPTEPAPADTPRKETFREAVARIRKVFAAQLAIDRTGIITRTVPIRAKLAAWAAILGLYVYGWTQGIVVAIEIATGHREMPERRPSLSVEAAPLVFLDDVALIGIAAAIIWAFRQYAGATVRPAGWATTLKTLPVAYIGPVAGFMSAAGISAILNLTQNSPDNEALEGPLHAVINIVSSGMAGPTEELALLAVVVVALRATGHNWIIVCVTAAAVRVPFHLYYGWGAIGLAVWAVLMVLLYKRTGAIIAIILQHASFNMLTYIPYDLGAIVQAVLFAAGVVIVFITWLRALKASERHSPSR